MTRSAILFAIVFCVFFEKIKGGPKLIVVLVDGVRWDLIDDPKLKGFKRITETGVRAPYVTPIFPSISYPNWYTIATGLYPENHGFVDNYLYDNDTDTYYLGNSDPNSTDPIWWNGAEPIWITAEKNQLTSAMYWWGGCEARIRGYHPAICERERFGPSTPEEKEDFLERIDDIVEMFKPSKRFPKDRLSLVLMYYGSTDYAGHQYGPNSKEMKEALYDIDSILDSMMKKLRKAGLDDEVNLMVVSDHGMHDLSNVKFIDIDKFSDFIKYQVSFGTMSMIIPQDNMLDKLYEAMKQANLNGVEVYKKENIPEKYRIKENERTTPIVLMANEGFLIKGLSDPNKALKGHQDKLHGTHGYDPALVEDMRTIFLATGPAFQERRLTDALNMTDLYNVMCSVLHLDPLPNNGSLDKVKSILKKDKPSPTYIKSSAPHHFYFIYSVVSSLLCLSLHKFKIL
ncbi:glycerophosphocholine cholinephosphodiesterase ENPP6-like [Parasteatoda tepidariorum]|uniref:glycerophosphocholine cholinephosphodiesterase ENPP6-like n=1 Tax=Parasteatoda tepidariorum TaxID=114398 RepID=UPI001C7192FD|nr:glycerophosphocholine cholinephosphodiesterase ENPP6-like [Parasteatoda tepidariorum]